MKVLVVDDSKPVRSILAKVFGDLGYECHQAADGREALEALARIGLPDLVTVNLNMPVMDGQELIRRMRADRVWKAVPLLVVSGEQDRGRIDLALGAGAGGFVAKPFTATAIAEALPYLGLKVAAPVAATPGRRTPGIVAGEAPLRVLVIDDSAAIRGVVSAALSADPELRVVGTAVDGRQGLTRIAELAPDIVLLDVEMPVMDGLSMLRELRRIQPRLPVVMFSTLTERGAKVALEALVAGANDYVGKPKGSSPAEVAERIREEVIPKLKQFRRRVAEPGEGARTAVVVRAPARPRTESVAAVVVAVSTGGPVALAEFLPSFVSRDGVPVLIVQHMPAVFTSHLAERLTKVCSLPVREAIHGQVVNPGDILLAPGGRHLQVFRRGTKVIAELSDAPPENSCRPAADVLFRTAAVVWGSETLGVVLTGMGKDGLAGSGAIRSAGGTVLAQDEATSVVWGMPGHVARAGLADAVLPLGPLGVEVGMRLRRRN